MNLLHEVCEWIFHLVACILLIAGMLAGTALVITPMLMLLKWMWKLAGLI